MLLVIRRSVCRFLLVTFSLVFFSQLTVAEDASCKPVKVDPVLATDAKLVLSQAKLFLKAYKRLDLDKLVPFIDSPSETVRSLVRERLEVREGRNLHHGVAGYCVEDIRSATDGFHSIVTGRAFYLSGSTPPEKFFFYVSMKANKPTFTYLMFLRSDTFHLSGAKPIS